MRFISLLSGGLVKPSAVLRRGDELAVNPFRFRL